MKWLTPLILASLLAPTPGEAARRYPQPKPGKVRRTLKAHLVHYRALLNVLGTTDKDIDWVSKGLKRAFKGARMTVEKSRDVRVHNDVMRFRKGRRLWSVTLTANDKDLTLDFLLGPSRPRRARRK